MKKLSLVFILLALLIFACTNSGGNDGVETNPINSAPGSENSGGERGSENSPSGGGQSTPITKDATEDCLSSEDHPIAVSIAEEYAQLTDYDEVIGWFCDGALFEDILNALTTEELSGVDAADVLRVVAEGQSWDEIWLELGITEE
ncbi:MAG TPA: hypothetical protein VJ965_01135 [Anaerolineales bacterium]|nr:hypothetical protein [Anaerolineales bacterium]